MLPGILDLGNIHRDLFHFSNEMEIKKKKKRKKVKVQIKPWMFLEKLRGQGTRRQVPRLPSPDSYRFVRSAQPWGSR